MPEWFTLAESRAAVRQTAAGRVPGRKAAVVTSEAQLDPELLEYMREWRRTVAKEQGVAAFVVLHDSTLYEICRVLPASLGQLCTITGIGERKADLYGRKILAALSSYRSGARATAPTAKKTMPALETLQLLQQGKTLAEIAQIRGRQIGTVVSAVTALVESGDAEFRTDWIDRNKQAVIEAACTRIGLEKIDRLRELKDVLPPEVTYDEIRLVLAYLRRQAGRRKAEIPA